MRKYYEDSVYKYPESKATMLVTVTYSDGVVGRYTAHNKGEAVFYEASVKRTIFNLKVWPTRR